MVKDGSVLHLRRQPCTTCTAFQNTNAKLVLSLKTSDTTTPFYIGMKSGTRDGEGQKWIAFEQGKTPYGFQRNGTWQTVEIPMSDLIRWA